MSQTQRAARDLSPFKGNIWDPDDSEWAEVDANKVVDTFQASYKTPGQNSPRKAATALSRLGSSIQDTLKSLVPLSTATEAANDKLREEEKRRDQLDELGNTYYCDPEGDLGDEVMKQAFLAGSTYFPAQLALSPRHMHVVDLDKYLKAEEPLLRVAKPRLCDAVATILSHTSQKCLEAFLDPTVKEFAYRRELDRNKAGLTLVISRTGNEVFAGAYWNSGFTLQWMLYVKSLVSITGQWHEVYATLKPGLTPIVKGVPQWGAFEPDGMQPEKEKPKEGSPRKIELSSPKKEKEDDDLSPTDPKFMLYQSRLLAKYLLWDIWVRFAGFFECSAIWEADGEVTNVRLRKALVGFG